MEADSELPAKDENNSVEDQLAFLRKENEQLKARTKQLALENEKSRGQPLSGGTGSKNLDSLKSFREEEQMKELKAQLKIKQEELSKTQESLKYRTNDYEEKLKRMRGIFAQASKSLDEYRALIADQKEQIANFETSSEESQSKLDQALADLAEAQDVAETLKSDSQVKEAQYSSQISALEMRLRHSNTQLSQITTEYQSYKQRANALLEEMSPQNDLDVSKITSLESELNQLKLERTDLMNESATSSQRMKVLEQDLRQTLETVERLQEEKKNFSKIKRQHNVAQRELEQLQRTIVDDKHRIDNAWEQKLKEQNQTILDLKVQVENLSRDTDTRVHEKDEEIERLRHEITKLNDEITTLNAQINLEDHNQEYQKSISESHDPSNTGTTMLSPDAENMYHHQAAALASPTASTSSVYASLSNLLSASQIFGSESSGGESPAGDQGVSSNHPKMKEKEYQQQIQHLAEMLNESETTIAALRAQEKVR
ncbi:hypothetical protein VKS41_001185 [Umbelopsis sp. WA50703]